ncbi:MAG: J domain-containing protein [Candidatus Poribacteria bacterium]|nr:J domain-containing protein [Candidatus Poribacteria bacterium]MDE0504265.1 J domain-containing protein [Candidatus Poribacteria bacterium]
MTRAEALRILGLQPDATQAEARKAHRQLVKAVHPDKNPDPNARHLFHLVQEAYELISTTQEQVRVGEREARARAEREYREREARARAEWEAKERAYKERRAKETRERQAREAQRKWERQRTDAAIGITGALGCSYKVPMLVMAVICPGISLVLCYILAAMLDFEWIFSLAPLVAVGSLILAYRLWELADKRVKEYQLREFDKHNPPPSKGAKEEMGDNAV